MPFDYDAFNEAYAAFWDSLDQFIPAGDTGSVLSNFQPAGIYRLDQDPLPKPTDRLQPTSLSQLPAIAIVSLTTPEEWAEHRHKDFQYTAGITIWTPGWDLKLPNSLVLKIIHALYRSDNGTGMSFLKAATGYHPQRITPVQWQTQRLGPTPGEGPIAMVATVQVGTKILMDPLAL